MAALDAASGDSTLKYLRIARNFSVAKTRSSIFRPMHALCCKRRKTPVLTKLISAVAILAVWRAQLSFSTRFAHTDSTLFERLSDTTGTIRSLRGTSPLGRGGAVGAIPFATVEGSYVGAQNVQALSRTRRLYGV